MPMEHGPIIWQNNSNDEKRFQQLFRQFHKPIVLHAHKWVSLHEAEEIAIDSFVKCWNLRTQFSHTKEVRSFLYTTARNAAIDHRRKQRRNIVLVDDIPIDQYPDLTPADMDREEVEAMVLQDLYETMQGMKGRRKQIALLAFKEGLSNKEISNRLSLSQQVVRNWRYKIVKKLRTFLGF